MSLVQRLVVSNRRTSKAYCTVSRNTILFIRCGFPRIRSQKFPVPSDTRNLNLPVLVKIRTENQSFIIHTDCPFIRSLRHGNPLCHIIRLNRNIRTTRLVIHVSIHISRDLDTVISYFPHGSNPPSRRLYREIRGIRIHVKRILM